MDKSLDRVAVVRLRRLDEPAYRDVSNSIQVKREYVADESVSIKDDINIEETSIKKKLKRNVSVDPTLQQMSVDSVNGSMSMDVEDRTSDKNAAHHDNSSLEPATFNMDQNARNLEITNRDENSFGVGEDEGWIQRIRPTHSDIRTEQKTPSKVAISRIRLKVSPEGVCCNLCGLKCSTNSDLDIHFLKIHILKTYKCKACDFKTSELSSLWDHFSSHGENFQCSICNYTSTSLLEMDQHKAFHIEKESGRPYICDGCDLRFSRAGNLEQHLKTHSDMTFFSCDLCDYKSTQESYLIIHKQTHLGSRPRSSKFADLNKDVIKPNEDGLYSCDKCQTKCVSMYNLVRHKRRKHSSEASNI